ncbi:hypothetical protein K3725_21710 (plasmid) [Leisingera sp. S132]|uniref:hypothetical protein n=1 Tax=Leisingera sp. S132 TaxID=2867016 RepID=UPI0021A51B31|nr:hypothetical protein [Leisingera sp. S132]UWQ81709.1 hypothetical protein K3725_21710 [Leisingera sp. S132]
MDHSNMGMSDAQMEVVCPHLGWKFDLKPNDEGVRVLSGLFYSSDTFQQGVDNWPGKVSVFIDPDNLNFATAVIPGRPTLFRLALQTTVFADLTVSEFLELMESYRREDPETTTLYEDRIAKVRLERFELLKKIGVQRRATCGMRTTASRGPAFSTKRSLSA